LRWPVLWSLSMPCIVKKSIMWTAPGWQCLCAI